MNNETDNPLAAQMHCICGMYERRTLLRENYVQACAFYDPLFIELE